MTRETKIGLLVGLAFLLVVGILLSEHITGATDRPAAPLANAGQGVGRGMGAPGATVEQPAKAAEPVAPVPTPQDLTPKPPVSQVQVVPPAVAPANPTQTVIIVPNPMTPPGPQVVTPPQPEPGQVVVVRPPTDPFANEPLNKLATDHGQPLVPINGGENARPKPVEPKPIDAGKPAVATAREYKAQPGDTLSRLASQVPGGNVKANREAIVALNPVLQKDPNRVLSGRSYLLPTQAAAKPVPAPQGTTVVVNVNNAAKPVVTPTPAPAPADGTRVYVVKAGDTLTKIAVAELGGKTELPALRSLNADVLKGGDVIKVNMKLKLPAARMLASVR